MGTKFYLSPGVYSREVDLSNIIPNIASVTAGLVGYSNKGDVDSIQLVTNTKQFIEEYGYPSPANGYFHYTALAYLQNGTRLYCKRVVNGALYGGVQIYQDGEGSNVAFSVGESGKTFQDVSGENIIFDIFGKDPGTWNNNIGIRITNVDAGEYTFDIEVYFTDSNGNTSKVETWTVSRKTKNDGFGAQLYLEDRINGFSKYISVADNTAIGDSELPETQPTTLAFVGGSNGSAITSGQVVLAIDEFANPDEVDIRLLLNGGYTDVSVHEKLKEVCESRKDCMAILDVPYDQLSSVSSIVNWREVTQNLNSSYVALYAPWIKYYDPYNDLIVNLPPSGFVASQYAYNDAVGQPWTAPAGFNRGRLNVIGLTNVFTLGERDALYSKQVNPLQTFRGAGNVIWGQKTEQTKASALSSVNVRRLLIVLEKAIVASLQFFAFEPNSDITRLRITSTIEEYMNILASQGAFQTELGDKGYRVVCDENNNTPAVIDSNSLNVDIYIKPSRAAEYIQLSTVITSTGASFQELTSRGILF